MRDQPPNHALEAPGSPAPGTSDRECLESWASHRDAASLQTLVERYLVFVHSSALRRTGDAAQAAEVTRAVFLVLARRARRLRKKTVLAGWLFHVTAVACRKLKRMGRLRQLWHWISRQPRPSLPSDATLWTRLAPQMDRALERLRTKQRNAVLLCAFLNHDFSSAAKVLRTSERRGEKRVGRGMKKLANRLRKRRAPVDPDALAAACATEGCAATVPEGLSLDILQSMEASRGQRPSLKLARRTLNTLAWLRWRRRVVIGWATVSVLIVILGVIAVYIDSRSGYSRLFSEGVIARGVSQGLAAFALLAVLFLAGAYLDVPENDLRGIVYLGLVGSIVAMIFANRSFGTSLRQALIHRNQVLHLILAGVSASTAMILLIAPLRALLHLGSCWQAQLASALAGTILVLVLLKRVKAIAARLQRQVVPCQP